MTDTVSPGPLIGGCLCGALRYRAEGPIVDSGFCHCRTCQRMGGPVIAWVEVAGAGFGYTAGTPSRYRSSETGERCFCPTCGAYLAFRLSDQPETVSINTTTLDDPLLAPPRKHIFCESRVAWLETTDTLPRLTGYGVTD